MLKTGGKKRDKKYSLLFWPRWQIFCLVFQLNIS